MKLPQCCLKSGIKGTQMNNHNYSHGHRFSADIVARMYGLESADLKHGNTPSCCLWILPDGTSGQLSINGATQYPPVSG